MDKNNSADRAIYIGEDVYGKFKSFLIASLASLLSSFDQQQNQLEFYAQSWSKYTISARLFSNLFAYIDKHFVAREKFENKRPILSIHELCMASWKCEIVAKVYGVLTDLFMLKLRDNRRGMGELDVFSMKMFTSSLFITQQYEAFEELYMKECESFYVAEAKDMDQCDPYELIKKV